jgi:hypothetical protein
MGEETKWAIPKADTIVRYPINKAILPIDGGYVPWIGPEGRYWRRREKEKSIIVFSEKPSAKTAEVKVEKADKFYDGGKRS